MERLGRDSTLDLGHGLWKACPSQVTLSGQGAERGGREVSGMSLQWVMGSGDCWRAEAGSQAQQQVSREKQVPLLA